MKIILTAILIFNLSYAKAQNTKSIIEKRASKMNKPLNYLALGDSYTIGESVAAEDSYPYQIKELLKRKNIVVATPKIIAKTGWTTADLLSAISVEKPDHNYSFVTLLIGVNNQYRGYNIATYKEEFAMLLDKAVAFANGDKNRLFVVSIPDWGVTPFAKGDKKSSKQIGQEIDAYNTIAREITLAAGVSFTDINPGSKNAATDVTLLADDALHPSGKMYANWANMVVPKILESLK